jgi:hypothetical protein
VCACDSRFCPCDSINNFVEFKENLSALLWDTFLSSFFPLAQQPLAGQGLVIIETSGLHSDTTHLVRFSGRVISPTQGPGDAKHLHERVFLCLVFLLFCYWSVVIVGNSV